MAFVNTDYAHNAAAIRDTNTHNGSTLCLYDFQLKTIIIENSLDQTVNFQCQASAHSDFSNSFNIGTSWPVSANTNTYQTCDSFFPYMRLTATCSTTPTSGTLTVHFVEYGV